MIACRGKNGWFNLKRASIFSFAQEDLIDVRLESKRAWRNVSPIFLQGPKDEIVNLLGSLKAQVEGGPCGMFELRSSEKPTAPKCSGGTNPELCAYCRLKMEKEVVNE